MEEVQIPSLGESINEGVIVRWLKKDGDQVAVDEPILELETDKASVEIPAPVAGVIHVDRAEGDTVRVGETVARIEPGAAPKDDGAAAAQESRDSTASADDEAPASRQAQQPAKTQRDEKSPAAAPARDLESLSPAVRRLVEENDLDPAAIEGSGRSGRITKSDVLRHIGDRGEEGAEPDRPAAAAPAAPAPPAAREEDHGRESRQPRAPTPYPHREPAAPTASEDFVRTPMTRLRRRIAERLLEAQRGAAILTTFNEVDMSAVLALRERFKKSFEDRHGVRLGFMSFFARACIAAMQDVPLVNARIDGEDVLQPNGVHLGIAVGTERGLVVPVLHHAHLMSFAEIEANIGRLAALAHDNKLSIADLSGGTFTISNGGVYGSLLSTPILNPPQSAILGMHKIERRPVVIDDEIVARPMMYLALSYDHRLIDGEGAVTFLVRVKERIEAPERLLLEV
jgi:2-oxoglutarate dehydrogenase E2 component (dihydrolipoamide succinyltransferase)